MLFFIGPYKPVIYYLRLCSPRLCSYPGAPAYLEPPARYARLEEPLALDTPRLWHLWRLPGLLPTSPLPVLLPVVSTYPLLAAGHELAFPACEALLWLRNMSDWARYRWRELEIVQLVLTSDNIWYAADCPYNPFPFIYSYPRPIERLQVGRNLICNICKLILLADNNAKFWVIYKRFYNCSSRFALVCYCKLNS